MEILTYERFLELASSLGVTIFSSTFSPKGLRLALGVNTGYPVFFRTFFLEPAADEAHSWSNLYRMALSELLILAR